MEQSTATIETIIDELGEMAETIKRKTVSVFPEQPERFNNLTMIYQRIEIASQLLEDTVSDLKKDEANTEENMLF